ncbi:MAG: pyridoxal-dependent decarboxylase [Bacteroidales bacterium]|nr:pyridoxal-dependent decarboxylase [Bacteroidales bacterium]
MKLNYNRLETAAKTFGDSFYILDIEKFKKNYRELESAFNQYYPTEIAYSYKTNYIPKICKTVDEEGGYAEVVSDMEYELAIKIGVKPERIIVNGPYKPLPHLEKFLVNGSIVNLDSYNEVELLRTIIEKHPDKTFNIGIRCNFDIESGTSSRFGFDTTNNEFYNLADELIENKQVHFINLHCHFPNRDLKYAKKRVVNLLDIYKKIHRNGQPTMLDIGGGLGGKACDAVKQQLPYETADYQNYAEIIAKGFKNEFNHISNPPTLILEPGTALVADTLEFVCKVLEIKNIRGKYFAMATGSKVNFNPMASTMNLPIRTYSYEDKNSKYYDSIDISGYTCMEGDYLHKNYKGNLNIGDFIVVENVGSYSVVFKPPFIRPNVPIIAFIDGQPEILKNKEDFEYIFQTYNFE